MCLQFVQVSLLKAYQIHNHHAIKIAQLCIGKFTLHEVLLHKFSNTMKKALFTLFVLLGLAAQAQVVTVSGDITTNTTWTSDNIYELTGGFVYVTNNAVLTIEPGTLIKGNASSLVITRGAKIMAAGTSAKPIVFTSFKAAGQRAPGDWGGVLILGRAPINDPAGQRLAEGGIDPQKGLYGGTDLNDNSGVFQYVRIEYAGIAFQPNNETNGLTCGAVGLGTTIDHVQVSFGGDDAFEFFGGTVNAKYLISYRGVDDEFDTDYGFTGRLQFCLSLRDSTFADVSGSNGFESDNDATGTTNGPLTKPIISNMTIVGPKRELTTTVHSNYKRAAHLRRSTSQSVYNSLLMGYPTGLKIENANTANNASSGTLQWKNNIIAGCPQALDSAGLTGFNFLAWYNANNNSTLTNVSDLMLGNPYNWTAPNFNPMPGSPALSGGDFSAPNLNNNFFTVTTYRGAFDGTNDWTACWANWDPQNTPYTSAGIDYLPLTVTPSGNTTFCDGNSVDLAAMAAGATYAWSNGATTATLNVTTAGTYTVTATNSAGCATISDPISVTVNPNPVANFYSFGIYPTISFGSISTGGTSYLWDFGDGGSSTDPYPTHTYAIEDTFLVCLTVTSSAGCVDDTCQNVSVSVAVEDGMLGEVSVSPNPATESARVNFSLEHAGAVEVALFTTAGQRVMSRNMELNAGAQSLNLDLNTVPAGLYMVRIATEESAVSLRLAVVH